MKLNRLILALGVCLIAGLATVLPLRHPTGSSGADRDHAWLAMALAAPDAGPMLSDSFVLARVNTRATTVFDFRDGFFSSDPMSRPATDSLGRVEFLNTMIGKDVLALTALSLNQPLSFEDRLRLQEQEGRVLAKRFFELNVSDSITVAESEIKRYYPQYSRELLLRYMAFTDQSTAQRVRSQLASKKLSWAEASRKYAQATDSLGWMNRADMSGPMALVIFELKPGTFTEPQRSERGFVVWQCLDQRTVTAPLYTAVRKALLFQIQDAHAMPRRQRVFERLRQMAQAHYDTTNMVWLSDRFAEVNKPANTSSETPTIDLRSKAPLVAPADTGRVLASTSRGNFSVHRFLSLYGSVPSMLRPKVWSFSSLLDVLDRMMLEPDMVVAARQDGLDKDPKVKALIDNRREALLVDRLYQDSVVSRVNITEADRKKYFEQRRNDFVTNERVRYAVIPRMSETGADSVIARLKAGESPESILAADSIAGNRKGSIQELVRGTPHNFSSVLFEDLREGEAGKVGPGSTIVLYVIHHEAAREMSYDEVRGMVDEWVQNLEAEKQLHALVDRLKKRYQIEAHPELVMRVKLSDPAGEFRTAPSE